MSPASVPLQAFRFARGLRSFLRNPVSLEEAQSSVERWWRTRDERFLAMVDDLVWAAPDSPYRSLLQHAGLESGDLRVLVADEGLEGALEHLCRVGVYVAYEEYLGKQPAVRGSRTFHFSPPDFANPRLRPDYMATSGGTRTGGTPAGSSFADRRERVATAIFSLGMHGVMGVPGATWMPALPGSSGIGGVLIGAAAGRPPERWMSPVDPGARLIPARKRAANWLFPALARVYGTRIPRPRYVPTSDPSTVLAWCQDALSRSERATLSAYPSSAVALAQLAVEEGVDLTGLQIRTGGEPLTPARRKVIESSGADTSQYYALSPAGSVAMDCPRCEEDEMHVMEQGYAVITRRRTRPDGVEVDAILCTTLALTAGQVLLNTENDDYAQIWQADPCDCPFGAIGMRRKIRGIRGISKVVAGGVSVDGELLQHLIDSVLPQEVGGGPSDYQFAEAGADGRAELVLRIAPRLGPIDEAEVLAAVERALNRDELGFLATAVWSPAGAMRVVREAPHVARSGKVLPFEPLPA